MATRSKSRPSATIHDFPGQRKSPENTRQAELHSALMSAVASQETASVDYGAKLVEAINGKVWEAPEIAGTLEGIKVGIMPVKGWRAYHKVYLADSGVRMTSKAMEAHVVPLGNALVANAGVPSEQVQKRIAEVCGVSDEAIRVRLAKLTGDDVPEWRNQYNKKEKGESKPKSASPDQVRSAIETMSAKEAADLITETLTEDKRAELADLLYDADESDESDESAPEVFNLTDADEFASQVRAAGLKRDEIKALRAALADILADM